MISGLWLALWLLFATGDLATERVDSPALPWLTHTVIGAETLEQVAGRHGVTTADLARWNAQLQRANTLAPGQQLRVRPRQFAPPRQKRRTWIQDPTTWEALAERFSVSEGDLRLWNPTFADRDEPPTRRTLVVWVESSLEQLPYPHEARTVPSLSIPEDGRSIGRPTLGRLKNGVRLPESDLYTIRMPDAAYGTSLTIRGVIVAIADFRVRSGFEGPIYIGALSGPKGRRLPPHSSHQSGRDVDIRLPALPFAYEQQRLGSGDVDWFATWALLDAFIRTETIDVIFVEGKFHRRLRAAGARLGAEQAQIDQIMRRVRDVGGHRGHMHVRFVCDPGNDQCIGEHRI